jgi:Ser/Thr protein kinase RdoA (MazF antagonist)
MIDPTGERPPAGPDVAFLGATFADKPADVSVEEALAVARRAYGFVGRAIPLPGERDHNFHLVAEGGGQYLLKFAHPAEAPLVTNLQTSALLHVAGLDPSVPVQAVMTARDGRAELALEVGGARRIVRLLGYRPGVPLHRATRTRRQMRNVGGAVADLDRALRRFDHPAARHEIAWDIRHVRRLEALLPHVSRPDELGLLRWFFRRFDDGFSARLGRARAQVIHNDANPHNLLVSSDDPETVSGIIDFGDIVHTALVCEVAILASYHLSGGTDPFDGAAEAIAGYHERLPLEADEVDLIPDLTAARCLVTVAITEWRAPLNPHKRDYILKNTARAWDNLERLASVSEARARRFLRRLCDLDET